MNTTTKKILFWLSTALMFGCLIWYFIIFPWNELNTPAQNLKKTWPPLSGLFLGTFLMRVFNYPVKSK